jgi:Fic-DOC domain mobile mystery protein B
MPDEREPAGETPGDDICGLLQPHLTDRRARDAAELEAIDLAYEKYIYRRRRKRLGDAWLRDPFIRQVHRDMFGTLWDWAGKYRRVNLNLGIDFALIQEQIVVLCGDFDFWNRSEMSVLEVAARLQNRLARIHSFNNGNGRHARLITDIFLDYRGHPLPRWPEVQLLREGDGIRDRYIAAMKAADQEDYGPLIAFMEECL